MPYIKREDRLRLDPYIEELAINIGETPHENPGVYNYVISRLLSYRDNVERYSDVNDILGVLFAVSLEFYRRQAAPYEDEKIEENGDILEYQG